MECSNCTRISESRKLSWFIIIVLDIIQLFPKLRRVIFLDDDVVVRQDLTELWNSDLNGNVNGAVTAAVINDKGYQQCLGKQYQDYLNFSNPIISSPLLGLESQKCAWLGGMNVFDLEAWRQTDITKTYQQWLKLASSSNQITYTIKC